jgi:hypothetical protein
MRYIVTHVASRCQPLRGTQNLKGTWPYDEVDSLVTHVMSDGRIDQEEHKFLIAFTEEFLRSTTGLVLETPIEEDLIRHGICAMQPEVCSRARSSA